MKKYLTTLLLFAGVSGFAIAAGGATATGNLSVTGTIPISISITVTPATGVMPLDLTTATSNATIATIVEATNDAAGYTVTVQSANAAIGGSGPYFSISGASDQLPYSLQYAGTAVSFNAAGTATITNATGRTPTGGTSNNLAISYGAAPTTYAGGTYSDTLTFTITGN